MVLRLNSPPIGWCETSGERGPTTKPLYKEKMLIYTDRLILSNFKLVYAQEFTNVLKDPRIFEYLPESVPDLDDIKKLIEWFIDRDLKNTKNGFVGTNLVISLKEPKHIIGWCGIQPFEPLPDKKEIFFGLSPDYWNSGYMTEAA